MKNSFCFFENKECEYYPCHEGIEELNCMFCYCPMYRADKCLGTPTYIPYHGSRIKDCSACLVPHQPENYERIIKWLGQNMED